MSLTVWRYRQFHVSYLLAWLGVGVLLGLSLGRGYVANTETIILLAGLALLLGGLRSARWWALPAVMLAGVCFGLLRGNHVAQEYVQYHRLIGHVVTLRGVISGDAQAVSSSKQKITVHNIAIGDKHYRGEVFVTALGKEVLKRGDTLTISGWLGEGFASYGASMPAGEIQRVIRGDDGIRDIRERFAEAVRKLVAEPMASLGLGFVVGQRSSLPDELDEQLKIVGLTHIVVASGYNLTILVRFMMRLLARHSRYLALVGSLVVIMLFVLFSGFSPSMNRAVVVTVLSLLAWYVGRRFHPALLLAYVAAATAFFKPMYVWADLGWYLSFLAFGGVLVVAPLIVTRLYMGKRAPTSFEQLVIETMSAELMALPLIAFAFGTVPVFGLIANVLVAPFIPFAMALTAAAGMAGMTGLDPAALFGLPAMILIGYMIAVVQWLANVPIAQLEFALSLPLLFIWYGLVAIVCLAIQFTTGYNFRMRDRKIEV